MKQQHHPIDIKTYEKGITSDVNKEILGVSSGGEHIDSLNMRSMSMDGNNLSKKKIKGEVIEYNNVNNSCFLVTPGVLSIEYQCMLTLEVNNHIVEVWASSSPTVDAPFIRVDGQVVLMSFDFPIDIDYPLQYDKNENCVSGEIYITNNVTPPIVLSLKDLMFNSNMISGGECTQKYFADFNLDEYVIQTSGTLYKPAFIKQIAGSGGPSFDAVFGTLGLAVGSYSYSYRYVASEGDRTPFSPITELIPVVRNNSSAFSPYFPNTRTFSSEPNALSPSAYGNHIRIKYENNNEFIFIEVRRDAWYAGEPVGAPPISEIIGSIAITVGLNIINILDRAEPLFEGSVILTLDEQTSQNSSIERAKSIRYYNEKLYLMNIGYSSKDLQGEIGFVDDIEPMFPTIEKIGKEGHKHVYNAAMHKSNMRGERTGFGIVLHDKANNSSYSQEIPNSTNFEFPNRRDIISSDTLGTSYKGVVKAATVDGTVDLTHEVFDHINATRRTEQGGDGNDGLISFRQTDPYATLNPTSQNDTTSDYQYQINGKAAIGGQTSGSALYNPKGFGLDYYAQGIAFKGITSYPSAWAEGFSVVQTDPARRVVAQGLGFYNLTESDDGFGVDASKSTIAFSSYFPDLELLSPDILTDLLNNPASYQLQLVSPLGYFTEVYSHENPISIRDSGADMITYARILFDGINYDETPTQHQFNPAISGGGNSGIPGYNGSNDTFDYVGYGRYSNFITTDSPAFPSNAQGNRVFNIIDAQNVATYSGIQTYLRVEIDQTTWGAIYNTTGPRSEPTFDLDANDDGVMEWREPMYVINLVKNDAVINPGITTQYKYSSSYIKFKSLILESTGALNQSSLLVSERWEDCIPSINGQVYNAYSSLYRFVSVVDINGIQKQWVNVTFETPLFVTTLLTNLSLYGFDTIIDSSGPHIVHGIYRSVESSDNLCPIFTLNFNNVPLYTQFTVPSEGSKVYVKYDNRIPVRVFGGDTYINESVWAVMDNEYSNNGNPKDSQAEFKMNIPFPMKLYEYAAGYRVWENSDPYNYTNDEFKFNVLGVQSALIRQLITMWTAETRINLSFAFNIETPDKAVSNQYFPLINYIPRPHKWKSGSEDNRTTFESNNNLNPLYYDDYGYEWNLWNFGGFRFKPQVNLDYSKSQTTNVYTSVPKVGFEEQTDYCTRIVWSERRPINIQNSPTVKTFPPTNIFDISDDTGEIKFAWSALSNDKGNNLYALTNSGICLLLIDKRVISEINGNELATVGSDLGGVLNQLWIDKTIGMSDETWRSWAEYSNSIFFVNEASAYSFNNNEILEIARTGFFDLLQRKFISKIGVGYSSELCGVYNLKNKEYIFNIKDGEEFSTLIYGIDQDALQCQSSYNYDKYLQVINKLYGMKDGVTYELGVGNQIDGTDIESYLSNSSDKELYFDKEFIRIRVNSNSKPEKIYFYDSYEDYIVDNFSSVVDATINPIAIKDYYGYECYIPRKLLAPNHRQQGRVLIFKITNSSNEDFLVTSTGIQYKTLK